MKRGARKRTVGREGPFIEIGHGALRALFRGRGIEVPLERTAAGSISEPARTAVREALVRLLGRPSAPRPALCSIPASGVSLRRLHVPLAPGDDAGRVLALQVETQFPLPPDRLAWGYSPVAAWNGVAASDPPRRRPKRAASRNGALEEVVLAAVRKEIVDEYSVLLRECGLEPVFSIGGIDALACLDPSPSRRLLASVETTHTDLVLSEDGAPVSVRVLPWGAGDLARAVAGAEDALDPLVAAVEKALIARETNGAGGPSELPLELILAGEGARAPGLEALLARRLERAGVERVSCSLLRVREAPGVSAATTGLARRTARGRAALTVSPALPAARDRHAAGGRSSVALWGAVALLLALGAIAARYAPPLLEVAEIEGQIAGRRHELDALPSIEAELAFLKRLKGAREDARWLDVLAAIARSAPEGARVETVSLQRSGELGMEGVIGSAEQANGFRRKLLVSGELTHVVLEELGVEEKKVRFRLQARVAPRAPPRAPPSAAEEARDAVEPAGETNG